MSLSDPNAKNDLERFVRLHSDAQLPLRAFIQTLIYGWANVEEVLQETNVVIWEKRESFVLGTNFLGWAKRIAYFESLRFRRNNTKDHQALTNQAVKLLAVDEMEDDVSIQKEGEALECCIEELRQKDRHLLKKRYLEGVTIKTIADEVGRPVRSVYTSLKRIRHSLRICVLRRLAMEE